MSLVKSQDLRPLLCYLILTEPSKAMEHLLKPPIASYLTKNPVYLGIVIHLNINVENVS